MLVKDFLKAEKGSIAVEWVVLIAATAIFLVVGVAALMGGMSDLLSAWRVYFSGGS